MNNIVKYCLAGIGAFALGVGGVYLVKNLISSDGKPEPVSVRTEPETVTRVAEPDEPAAVSESLPGAVPEEPDVKTAVAARTENEAPAIPELAVDKSGVKVRLESNGVTYSVTGLKAVNASSAGARFVLSDSEHHVFRSSTGDFKSVAGNTKGVYAVAAYDNATGVKSKVITIGGFKSTSQSGSSAATGPVEKLTAAELASVFNTGNSDNLRSISDRITGRNCRVSSNDPDVSTMSDVFRKVNMEEKKVTVSNVKYDSYGRVTSLTVNLQ